MTRIAWLVLVLLLPAMAEAGDDALLAPPPGGPVPVRVGFFLVDINDVNERDETFEIEARLTLRWRDPRQGFDPGVVGVPARVYQGNFQFDEVFTGWWPQLVLTNGIGNRVTDGVLLEIEPDGTMALVEEFNATIEMPSNLRRFPFDHQRFRAYFEPLGMGTDRVVLTVDPERTGRSHQHVDIAQWRLRGVEVETTEVDHEYQAGAAVPFSQFVVSLDMARRPGNVLGSVILPLTILVALTWSIFWMDEESLADRINISFIGILTVVAYHLVIRGQLPEIPYFTLTDGFLLSTFLILAASVVVNLVVDKLNRRGMEAVGDRVDRICRWAFPLGFALLNALLVLYFLGT